MRPLIRSLRFTVLVDDAPGNPDPRSVHGLSLWIEADHYRVLFDTAQGATAMDNARALGLEPAEVDAVAISHGHDDHTGGLPAAPGHVGKPTSSFTPSALRGRYWRSADGGVRAAGLLRRTLDKTMNTCPVGKLYEKAGIPMQVRLEVKGG